MRAFFEPVRGNRGEPDAASPWLMSLLLLVSAGAWLPLLAEGHRCGGPPTIESAAQDWTSQFPYHQKSEYFDFYYRRESPKIQGIVHFADGFVRLVNRDFFKADFDYCAISRACSLAGHITFALTYSGSGINST